MAVPSLRQQPQYRLRHVARLWPHQGSVRSLREGLQLAQGRRRDPMTGSCPVGARLFGVREADVLSVERVQVEVYRVVLVLATH